MTEAPAPRLEFRWRKEPMNEKETLRQKRWGDDTYFCDYGIVIPLKREDIRAEGDDGTLGVHKERFFLFGTTACGGSEPWDGQVPFRDGVHASWDSEALGGLPVWVASLSGHHGPVKKTPK
jgi:hypothetical protein